MRIVELRQRASRLVEDAKAIVTKAEAEGRLMTPEERAQAEKLVNESAEVDAEITTLTAIEDRDRQIAGGPSPNRNGNTDGRGGDELPNDCILNSDETFESRARREHGDDDQRFGPMMRASFGANVADLRESEMRVLATSSGGTGGFLVPAVTSARILDKLVNLSRVFEAGAQRGVLPSEGGEFAFGKHSTGPATQWVAENSQLADADITFTTIKVIPRILACGPIKVPRKLIDQSSVNFERFIQTAMEREMAVEIDRASLFGKGTAREPLGLTKQLTGTSDVTGTGAITNYDEIVDATKVLADNNAPDATAMILAPREDNTIAKFKTGITSDNTPLIRPPKISNLPFLPTNQIPITEGGGTESRMIVGHFPHMTIFFQGVVQILPLRERYADKLQVGFIAFLYVDLAITYPVSFVSIGGVTP